MKKPILTVMAALVCLTLPVSARAQDTLPAGTDQTGTSELGVQSSGTRSMVNGESGEGVTGRGVGEDDNFPESNKGDRSDTSVPASMNTSVGTTPDGSPAPVKHSSANNNAAASGTYSTTATPTADPSGAGAATTGE